MNYVWPPNANLAKHFPYHTSIFIQTDLLIIYDASEIELVKKNGPL
jgi:hypothetical protein